VAPAAIVAVAIGVPLLVRLAAGSFGLPQIDDWGFYRVAATLMHGDGIHFIGWGPMLMVGHLFWALPFFALLGTSVAAAQWSGMVASAIALTAAYSLFSRFLDRRTALFGTAVLAAFPVFALLNTTYMTDVTALAAQLVCLALGVRALDTSGPRRTRLLAGSLAVGFLGFAIREPSVAAPLAVIAGHAVAARRDGRSIVPLAAALAALVAGCAALWAWRQGLPGDQAGGVPGSGGHVPGFSINNGALIGGSVFLTLGLAVAPALVFRGRAVAHALRRPAFAAIAALVVVAALADALKFHGRITVFPGGSLIHGVVRQGADPGLFPVPVWGVLLAVAALAGAALAVILLQSAFASAGAARRDSRSAFAPRTWTLIVFGTIAGVMIFGRAASEDHLWDRYLLPLLPAVVLLVLATGRQRPGAWKGGLAALAGMALVAVLYVGNSASFSAASWHASERLVAAGYPPTEVDGSLEWVGYHYHGVAGGTVPGGAFSRAPLSIHIWQFPRSGNCAMVSQRRLGEPWLKYLGSQPYRTSFGLGERRLWLYRNEHACSRGDIR
jgi:hypothetical protein